MSTRDRIIHSATVLFWRHGYNAVSVDAICEAAERPKGSFYYAFPSKEELLVAVIRHRWASDRREILSCYDIGQDLSAQFQRHLEWFGMNQRRLLAQLGFAPGSFNMSLESGIPLAASDIIRASRSDHYKILLNTISQLTGLNSESVRANWLTMVVVRFTTAALMEARLENSLDPFNTLPESVFSLVGLAPQPWA